MIRRSSAPNRFSNSTSWSDSGEFDALFEIHYADAFRATVATQVDNLGLQS